MVGRERERERERERRLHLSIPAAAAAPFDLSKGRSLNSKRTVEFECACARVSPLLLSSSVLARTAKKFSSFSSLSFLGDRAT